VDKAESAFAKMPADKLIRICYEDFVQQPDQELVRILKFLGIQFDTDKIGRAVESVSKTSIGKGRNALSDLEVENLELLVSDSLKRYGYL